MTHETPHLERIGSQLCKPILHKRGDQDAIEILTKDTPRAVYELENMGVPMYVQRAYR